MNTRKHRDDDSASDVASSEDAREMVSSDGVEEDEVCWNQSLAILFVGSHFLIKSIAGFEQFE